MLLYTTAQNKVALENFILQIFCDECICFTPTNLFRSLDFILVKTDTRIGILIELQSN